MTQPVDILVTVVVALFLALGALVWGVVALVALFGKGFRGWTYYALILLLLTVPLGAFRPWGGVLWFAWLVGVPMARSFLLQSPRGRRWVRRHPWLRYVSKQVAGRLGARGSGGFVVGGKAWPHGPGSHGGGVSGGGGSFGGGGASGSW